MSRAGSTMTRPCAASLATSGRLYGARRFFAWRRIDEDVEPPVVELCEICNAAAGGPTTLLERV
jgi:hypothetical protein